MKTIFALALAVTMTACAIEPPAILYGKDPATTPPSAKCQPNYILTKSRGCIRACSHPDFKQCADAFIDIYDPKFCALAQDGSWKSFTFDCQACGKGASGYLGVANGECGNQTPQVPKPVDIAEPLPINKCSLILCTPGTKCIDGACVPIVPTPAQCAPRVYCPDARPTEKECPTLYYIRQPDPQFSGVRSDGTRAQFPRDCQACMDKSVVYHLKLLSDRSEPLDCKDTELCQNGKCITRQILVDPPVQTICKQNYIFTKQRGCVKACSHPDFKNCGDIFITLWNPKYCALNKDGTWRNFTFDCQACTNKYPNTQYLGVADGVCESSSTPVEPPVKVCTKLCIQGYKCVNGECVPVDPPVVDQCIFMKCSSGFICKNSKCIPVDPPIDRCASVRCKSGFVCLDGLCIPKITTCPADAKYKTIVCSQPRPNIKQCPILYYIRQPDPLYCGVRADGTRVNFPRDCEACMDKSIVYYFDKPCSLAPKVCKDTEKCVNGNCLVPVDSLPVDLCKIVLCPKNKICVKGTCVDDPCSKCAVYETCTPEKTCIDKCALIRCASGYKCQKGQCIPVQQMCKAHTDCLDPEICQDDGTCFNICITTKCQGGYICLHGSCIPEPRLCQTADECGVGQNCNGKGVCQDKCTNVKCPSSQVCVQGRCEDVKCKSTNCPLGTFCKNGICVPDITVCPADSKYETKVCTDPRPNNVTCPVIYYIRAPDPEFCGVRADGTRVNFARDCEACKDKSIVYFFTQPCHKVPFTCKTGDYCLDYYCASPTCSDDEVCPYDWQTCTGNKCVDRCALMKCANCKYGQCAYEEPSGKCTLGAQSGCKKDSWQCIGFECADPCLKTSCPPYQRCNKGNCEPISAN